LLQAQRGGFVRLIQCFAPSSKSEPLALEQLREAADQARHSGHAERRRQSAEGHVLPYDASTLFNRYDVANDEGVQEFTELDHIGYEISGNSAPVRNSPQPRQTRQTYDGANVHGAIRESTQG
jgi:hypothetical protein